MFVFVFVFVFLSVLFSLENRIFRVKEPARCLCLFFCLCFSKEGGLGWGGVGGGGESCARVFAELERS